MPSTCCLGLEYTAARGSDVVLHAGLKTVDIEVGTAVDTAAGIAVGFAGGAEVDIAVGVAVWLHSAPVDGASGAYHTDGSLAGRCHSSSCHGHAAARLDKTWLSTYILVRARCEVIQQRHINRVVP